MSVTSTMIRLLVSDGLGVSISEFLSGVEKRTEHPVSNSCANSMARLVGADKNVMVSQSKVQSQSRF